MHFIQENAFKHVVCENVANLSRPPCVILTILECWNVSVRILLVFMGSKVIDLVFVLVIMGKYYSGSRVITVLGPVSLRLMTSQFKDIVTHTQKLKTVKCMFCGVWVQNFVWNFKGALWNFTQNFEPIHRKICILRGFKNLTTYDILELWHLKS